MLILLITASLLALSYGGDTFWDATSGECQLFTSTTPAIFTQDSGRCGVCPATTCEGHTDQFNPRCFSLSDPITDTDAIAALTAKCFDTTNTPACDVSSNEYFEWDDFPSNCAVDTSNGGVDNNGCPSCVDSNTACDSTTTPIFVVQAPPSQTCIISGCMQTSTDVYARQFASFQFEEGVKLDYLSDATTLLFIRDKCPDLVSNCNEPAQWVMDVCKCPSCLPATTSAGTDTTTGAQTTQTDAPQTTKTDTTQAQTTQAQTTSRPDTTSNPATTSGGDASTTDDFCDPDALTANCASTAKECHTDTAHPSSAYPGLSAQQQDDWCGYCLCDYAFGTTGQAEHRCMYTALTEVGLDDLKNDKDAAMEALKEWFVETCFSQVANCAFDDVEINDPVIGCECGSFSCNGEVGVFVQGSANKYAYGIGLVISFLLYIIA